MPGEDQSAGRHLDLVRRTVGRELEPLPLPGDDEDLARAGVVDSMTRVNILLALEETAGAPGFAAEWPDDRPFSLRELAAQLSRWQVAAEPAIAGGAAAAAAQRGATVVSIAGWAAVPGSAVVPAEGVDAECGLAPGFLRSRTGIESVRRASPGEDEAALAASAAASALEMAAVLPADVDLLVGVSTTHLAFPSLAARLHAELLLRDGVGALDVGGACCGVIYALATASSLLATVGASTALVVASEVNSRRLAAADAPPEFRALFGDAACAFVLRRSAAEAGLPGRRLLGFTWGASATLASTLGVFWPAGGSPHVEFRGEQLAIAAIETLERILDRLAALAGVALAEADQFALHEPNPRLAAILVQKAGIPLEKAPRTSATWGNVGSATCGSNLCLALTNTNADRDRARPPVILAAAVGPGLLWGGAYIG